MLRIVPSRTQRPVRSALHAEAHGDSHALCFCCVRAGKRCWDSGTELQRQQARGSQVRQVPLTCKVSVQADCADLREKLEEAKKQQRSQEDMIRWLNKQVCWHHCSMLMTLCRHLCISTMTAICLVCAGMISQGALCKTLRFQGCP